MFRKLPKILIKDIFDFLKKDTVVSFFKAFPQHQDDQYLMKRMGYSNMIEMYDAIEKIRA